MHVLLLKAAPLSCLFIKQRAIIYELAVAPAEERQCFGKIYHAVREGNDFRGNAGRAVKLALRGGYRPRRSVHFARGDLN